MRKRKLWYIFPRRGIYQVQYRDQITGNILTAKSTGTRNRDEAEQIASEWYYDPKSQYNQNRKEKIKQQFFQVLRSGILSDEEIIKLFQAALTASFTVAMQWHQNRIYNGLPFSYAFLTEDEAELPAIQELFDKLHTLTFQEYTLLFWNYQESPYIKQLQANGSEVPNPERFNKSLGTMRKYAHLFPHVRLIELTATQVNILLGKIKAAGNLKDRTMYIIRGFFAQALHFAYKNNLISRDIAHKIVVQVSQGVKNLHKKADKKEIFKKSELHRLFNEDKNPFGREVYQLLNESLFKTGCRIGELQALMIRDIIKTEYGYALNIDKSYCRAGDRIKDTKTGRCDLVPISAGLAHKLLAFVEKSPFKQHCSSFVFYSKKEKKPLNYNSIYKNFNATIKRLGMSRKGLTLHSYRHTYATFLLDEGFSESELLYLTRHDNPAELKRYSEHMTPEKEQKKRRAAAIIDKVA